MILGIMILAFVAILSNNAFAQTLSLYDQTLEKVAKETSGSQHNPWIDVGFEQALIAHNPFMDKLYVVDADGIVSVIDVINNTKIADIPVGEIIGAIAVDSSKDKVYVAHLNNSAATDVPPNATLSVINATNYAKIADIPLGGRYPALSGAIAVDSFTDKVYVANIPVVVNPRHNATSSGLYGNATVSVIDVINNTKIADIPVGEGLPSDIDVDNNDHTVTVATTNVYHSSNGSQSRSNTISIINGINNTRIADIVWDRGTVYDIVSSGYYQYIASNNDSGDATLTVYDNLRRELIDMPFGKRVITHILASSDNAYVANKDDYDNVTVSVIDPEANYAKIADIPVGKRNLVDLDLNSDILEDYIFFLTTSIEADTPATVSVINATNYAKIADIPLDGIAPLGMAFNHITDTLYVADRVSTGVSVIEPFFSHKAVVGATFHIKPFNSGSIVCDDLSTPYLDELISPTEQYLYVPSHTQCTAKPNEGFEFLSWEENLKGNATQLVNVSRAASSLDSFLEFLHLKSVGKPEATLKITKFGGTFTANFKEAPPPLPQEFWVQLSAVLGTVVTALFIPSIVSWFKSKRDVKKLNYFHKQIASLYGDGKLDENDIEALDRLRKKIGDAYSEGKINDKHYESLKNEISTLYERIFRKRINDSVNNNGYSAIKKPRQEQLVEIRNDIEYAYSEGKINEKHYDLLTKAISNLDSKETAS
jgi:DNA-binding beta-propeller fold protein YncE